jgi:tetratricopeptide (TPR) repeat protein
MRAEEANSKDRPQRTGDFNPDLSAADFEMEFWGRVLDRDPYYHDVLRRQAEALARAGRHQELLPIDRRMVELRPQSPVVRYNLACTLARLDMKDDALAALRQAVELGYDDFGHIETDTDLDTLRELPEFKKLFKKRRTRK